MRNVLILTEKKSFRNNIKDALVTIPDHITIKEIGGRIYLDEDKGILKVSEQDLNDSIKLNLPNNEVGYVLGKETIDKNIEEIKMVLSDKYDVIINACDYDRSGELLFDYAAKLLNIDTATVQRMIINDFTANSIRESYLKTMDSVKDTDLEEER